MAGGATICNSIPPLVFTPAFDIMPSAISRSRDDNTDYHKQGEGLRQMTAPRIIVDLVERFDRNREAYRAGHYNETQLRREFIDPFFKALGWDIDNEQGNAENYKDVIHEDAIKIGSATKAPDYCFRIGGSRKFFLEAKKPSIDIKGDPGPAYQLRRYAWSAKLPLSILTDFEEFAVYDCRIRPIPTDKSSAARIFYLKYTDYTENWDKIVSIFSKDAVLKGSFDKYADTARLKKGTAQVDDAFLLEIESWRSELARSIALRNPKLNNRQLNFAVQMTIDRIIFLRICEDRGVESPGQLQALLNGDNTYQRLLELFLNADDRYNSGLFHLKEDKDRPEDPDELTPTLAIDDKVLKDIFRRLYYPESPYVFSVLPTEILGQVYEQFLGRVITLTAGHHAKVEEKPEVKKAGGVFYTPSYIVGYIVRNTVGRLVEGKTPKEVEKIKILDPACGSGSFLLGAYQYLLDWHLKWYLDNDPKSWTKKRTPPICQTTPVIPAQAGIQTGGAYKLTLDCRKRILLNNIFGVDIDSQAVEVTKLSLLLKVLEGEKQLVLFHRERALPDLGQNIKCGNSLIAPDFYRNQQMTMFDDEQKYKINAFDWQTEFKDIFSRKNPGFDAVIGNPPYVQVLHSESQNELEYYSSHYVSTSAFKKNLFPIFIEQSIRLLRKEQAFFSMIIPDRFFFTPSYVPCRQFILKHGTLEKIREILSGAFDNAIVGNAVFFISTPKKKSYSVNIEQWMSDKIEHINNLPVQNILSDSEAVINLLTTKHASNILEKCNRISKPLKTFVAAHVGIMIKDNKNLFTLKRINKSQNLIIKGRCIQRYSLVNTYYFDYSKAKIFGGTKNREKHEAFPKILLRKTGNKLVAHLDDQGIYAEQSVYLLLPQPNINPSFVISILNSKLLQYLFQNCFITNPIAYPYIQHYDLENLPIRNIDFSNKSEKTLHDKMVSLVEVMLDLHKKLASAKTPNEKTVLQRQIDATDDQIDQLVYELYGLTADEIAIVENSVK